MTRFLLRDEMRMQEKIFEKYWGKPTSIPILIVGFVIGAIIFIPSSDENWLGLIIYIIATLVISCFYVLYVIKRNTLPHCKKNELGVLFVFRIASDTQYDDFKFTIEQNFKNNLQSASNKIVPIFLNSSSLKKYDANNPPLYDRIAQYNKLLFLH